MTEHSGADCQAEFKQAMPEKPWNHTAVTKFEPLINLIDQRTQSDMFRHQGKYETNGDYYDIAHDLDDNNQDKGSKTFENGVRAQIEQVEGWPTKIILEDDKAHLKETVAMDPSNHRIESDKVEFCGVSRERTFSQYGESFRAYHFPGGSVEKSSSLPVLKLE
ncbi:MAG: hypothetical protein KGS72_13260 [Cyanobacteria bacterium REEB67]|nr:hypothetical protein [Cyanobacteria bacterium REEB67]